jgi:hypothetical protein
MAEIRIERPVPENDLGRRAIRGRDRRHAEGLRRRSRERVALTAADELASPMETARLLRSPKNALRLLGALR